MQRYYYDFRETEEDLGATDEYYEVARLQVMFLIFFILMYLTTYPIISYFKTSPSENAQVRFGDMDDVSNRIALWLCNISLGLSLATMILLPATIMGNEIIYRFPDSSLASWLTADVIYGMWNNIFVCTNITLFILLPFAYFFTEAEGIGNSRGLIARVNETVIVWALCALILVGVLYVSKGIVQSFSSSPSENVLESYYTFLYSSISFVGALVMLRCTSLGFTLMFAIAGKLVQRPNFLTDSYEQMAEIRMQEDVIERLKRVPGVASEKLAEYNAELANLRLEKDKIEQQKNFTVYQEFFVAACLLVNFFFASLFIMRIFLNVLSLLGVWSSVTIKIDENFEFGTSTSFFGLWGALTDVVLVIYFLVASALGFYSHSFVQKLLPEKKNTPIHKIILNSTIFLLLSSSLPTLSFTLGLTSFNILGHFTDFAWLGNFYLKLVYNLTFMGVSLYRLCHTFIHPNTLTA